MKTLIPIVAAIFTVSFAHAQSVRQPTKSWVKLTAQTDRTTYAPGQEIKVNLIATNTHQSGAFLQFNSGQRFDLKIFRAGTNQSVYTWSATRMFTQSLGDLWLKKGQSQRYTEIIAAALPAGKYELVANLSNSPRPIIAKSVGFEIVPQTASNPSENPAVDAPLKVTARADKTRYRESETAKISVTVANLSDEDKIVDIKWGRICDVRVRDAQGRVVRNWGANLRFVRMLGPTKFRAGQSNTIDFVWDGQFFPSDDGKMPLLPGRFTVEGFVASRPEIVSPRVAIEIVP